MRHLRRGEEEFAELPDWREAVPGADVGRSDLKAKPDERSATPNGAH